MKRYYCKICERRGKEFKGIRRIIREHLKEYHGLKCRKEHNGDNKQYKSEITEETGSEEI